MEIDYGFFTIRRFLDKMKLLKYFIFFMFVVPVIMRYDIGFLKRMSVKIANYQKQQKEEKERKKA